MSLKPEFVNKNFSQSILTISVYFYTKPSKFTNAYQMLFGIQTTIDSFNLKIDLSFIIKNGHLSLGVII